MNIARICMWLFSVTALSTVSLAGSIAPADPSPADLIATGQYQLAADVLVRMVRQNHTIGQNRPSAILLSNLGLVYDKLGRYVEAEHALEKALGIFRDLGDTSNLNYARTLNHLANVQLSQRRYASATELLKESLALYRRGLTEQTRDIALVLNNLGSASLRQQQYAQAEQLFRESLSLSTAAGHSPEMAVVLNNIALLCKLQNRLPEAAALYLQAIEVWRGQPGNARREVAIAFHNLASLESDLGANNRAEEHFKEALAIAARTFPPEHPSRTTMLTAYANLLMKLGRKREAKQLLSSVRVLRAEHERQNFQNVTVDVRSLLR